MKKHPIIEYLNGKSMRKFCREKNIAYPTLAGLIYNKKVPSIQMIAKLHQATDKKVKPESIFSWHFNQITSNN